MAPSGTEQEELNGVASIEAYNFPTASGIDSLYYFIQSNGAYEKFYYYSIFDIVEQARELHGGRIPKDALKITISDIPFVYLGKEQGFYFFADLAGMFRVGFKDPQTNRGVHDIRVQLQGVGIYSMGLVELTEYINTVLLREITTDNYFITRADLNIFCQYDLGSVVTPEHIVTRKRKFARVIGKKNTYETLYIGKPPAMLRIYDKALEIDHFSTKAFFLKNYLQTFGMKMKEPLWNFEFECHRDFFKQYKITTLDDLLRNTELLFHKVMEQIRLADISKISQKDIEANRLYKAPNHPLWDYLNSSYRFESIVQKTIPLDRVVYSPKELIAKDFINEFKALADKYAEHSVIINHEEIREILHQSHLLLSKKAQKIVKPFVPIELQTDTWRYLLTRNFVAVPILPKSFHDTDNEELKKLDELLTKALHQELAKEDQDLSLIIKHTRIVKDEINRRRVGQKELELWQQ